MGRVERLDGRGEESRQLGYAGADALHDAARHLVGSIGAEVRVVAERLGLAGKGVGRVVEEGELAAIDPESLIDLFGGGVEVDERQSAFLGHPAHGLGKVAQRLDDLALRVAITGGGCNGLSYKMRFVAEPKAGDILVRSEGIEVLVDPKSALYLRGTHLDYSDKMIGGGFKFSNPNAKASCSCGESFSL